MKNFTHDEIEKFRNGWKSDEFHNEIDRAMRQTDEENEKNLQWLIDKRNRNIKDLQWLENQVKQYRQQLESAKSFDEIVLLQANVGRLQRYFTELLIDAKYKGLTLSTLPKKSYLNTLEAGREHLAKLQKRIDTRIKYFDEDIPIRTKI